MRSIAFIAVLYLLVNLLVLGLGCAAGFLLRWMMPEIDLGAALLTGVVATGFTIHFFTRLMATIQSYEVNMDEEGAPFTVFALQPPRPPRRRRKKS